MSVLLRGSQIKGHLKRTLKVKGSGAIDRKEDMGTLRTFCALVTEVLT